MTRPEIAVVVDGVERDGDTRWLLDTLRFIDRRKYRVHVVSLHTPSDAAIDVQKLAVPVHSLDLPDGESGGTARWTFAGTLTLFNLFRKMKLDLVHTMGSRADVMGRIAARFTGVGAVTSTWRRPTGTSGGWRSMLTRMTTHMADVVCAPSAALASEVMNRFGVHPRRTRVVAPGVDLERLIGVAAPDDLKGDGPLVVAACRMDDSKGVDTLIDATAILRRYHGKIRVMVVGTGVAGIGYIRRSQKLGIDDVISIPGDRKDIPGLLAAADVFVHPARRDGLPLALLEAMGAGVPCVATTLPSILEHVEDQKHALLCAPDHPAFLADRIDRLLTDPDLANGLAIAGSALVRERFVTGLASRGYQDVWDQLVG